MSLTDDRRFPAGIILAALILAIGPAFAGFMVHKGLVGFQNGNNFVTVKGVAQKDIEADLVIWPIKHTATGNDLPALQQMVEDNTQKILAFLKQKGLKTEDVVSRRTEVTDLLAQSYRTENAENSRYIVSETVIVRTTNVNAVEAASQDVGELLKAGISLVQDPNGSTSGYPQYIYTKLNDIKPGMIAEATRSARESAQQFAKDSSAHVGTIREANQGTFEILPRDSDNSDERKERFKTIRVVSTLKYYLD